MGVGRRRVEHKESIQFFLVVVGLGFEELFILVAEFESSAVAIVNQQSISHLFSLAR